MPTDGPVLERLDSMVLNSSDNAMWGVVCIVAGVVLLGKAAIELLLVIFIIGAVAFAILVALPLRLVLAVYDYLRMRRNHQDTLPIFQRRPGHP